jgi:signal transduction histidine kinase
MKSLQWRIIAVLGLVILVTWSLSTSIIIENLSGNPAGSWVKHLDALGTFLLKIVPQEWVSIASGKPDGLDGLRSNLIAIVLNTLQLVFVGVVMVAAIRLSMRPLSRLSRAIQQRAAFDTSPIPTRHAPSEVDGLIHSFNALLERLELSIQAERELVSNAAHELRTPLAALHAQAEIARQAENLEQKNASLDKLLNVSDRSIRLTEQLLDLARLEGNLHLVKERVDLCVLAAHVIDEFRLKVSRASIKLTLSGAPCPIRCDIDEVGVLIRNLVDNAIKYGGNGSAIEVQCSPVTRDGVHYALLEVCDDGPGVPLENRRAIFDRFYRIPGSSAHGSGIGLSLVAGVAKLHDAVIETGDGKQGRGFKVSVYFPADEPG